MKCLLGPELRFKKAKAKAFFNEILATLSGQPTELVPFEQVVARLRIRSQYYKGLREVELDKIVGSVGRYHDFDRAFLPTQAHTKDRWKAIAKASREGEEMPPVQLYQVGDIYFVRDGHHRVSVAREEGRKTIVADVVVCQSRVPITTDIRPEDLELLGEYESFLRATGLYRLRPDTHILFSQPGQYERLLEHISVHRYYMGLERKAEVPWEEAVAHWHDKVYTRMVKIIREREILKDFPNRTEADLYVWIMDHLYYLRERYGGEVGEEIAAIDFAGRFGGRLRGLWLRTLEWFRQNAKRLSELIGL
jgi:uncharacterized ParB-like nuclease family protein